MINSQQPRFSTLHKIGLWSCSVSRMSNQWFDLPASDMSIDLNVSIQFSFQLTSVSTQLYFSASLVISWSWSWSWKSTSSWWLIAVSSAFFWGAEIETLFKFINMSRSHQHPEHHFPHSQIRSWTWKSAVPAAPLTRPLSDDRALCWKTIWFVECLNYI